jgi:peptide/nickel transport system substrate-binding protein
MNLRRTAIPAALGILSLTLASACAGGSSSGTSAAGGGSSASGSASATGTAQQQNPHVLSIASAIAPNSLNPALGGQGDPQQYYFELAYDTLVHQAENGSYQPGLATAWNWVGTGNRSLELTLRSGVEFSDGSSLTATDVKNWLKYYTGAGGPLAADLGTISSVDVLSPTKLIINLAKSDPDLLFYFAQTTTGSVISPKGLADPGELGTTTAGAGEYVLDQSATVTGQTYTYTPNPHYWNRSAIHWQKVVVKVITDSNATLAALQSGEVDYALGDASTAKAAQQAGIDVSTTPNSVMQLILMDHDGKLSKPLSNLKVRQAMMYALDRGAIATSLFGSYARGSDTAILPVQNGYSSAMAGANYTYDPTKAKQLLAEAGYPNGFTLPIIVNLTGTDEPEAAQAFAAEMANIGVNVKIDVPANVDELFATYSKYPAMMFDYGTPIETAYAQGYDLLYSWGNPFKQVNSNLNSLYQTAAAAPASQAHADWQAFELALSQQLYTIPIFSLDRLFFSRPGLSGIDLSGANPNPPLIDLYAS